VTVYYYPNPAAKPATTNIQYVLGDYYVDSALFVWKLAKSIAGNSWQSTQLTDIKPPTTPPSITTATLVASTSVTANQAVNFKPVAATGGSALPNVSGFNLSISPALPTGLSLSTVKSTTQITDAGGVTRLYNLITVVVSGTPTAAVPNTTFTVTFTDAANNSGNASFALEVLSGSVALTSSVAVPSTTLVQYTAATAFTPVTTTGGVSPLTYSISPALVSGLTLNTATGQISGTPTGLTAGTSYTITVTDSNVPVQTTSKSFTIIVNAKPVVAAQQISIKNITEKVATSPFTPVTASGGYGVLSYSISPALPSGMSISASTGTISGTPTNPYPTTVYTVTATDSNTPPVSGSANFTMTVNALPALTTAIAVASIDLKQNTAVTPFIPITASGGYITTTYSITPTLPVGLIFDIYTGQITGTPTTITAAANYTVTATDSASQSSSQKFSLSVSASALVITVASATKTVTQGLTVTAFTPITATGGYGSLTYAISPTLPAGLTFNTGTGAITGTATVTSAATTYTVTITGQASQSGYATFSLTVDPPPAVVTVVVVATKDLIYRAPATTFTPVTASGGTGTLVYSISPALPNGLTFNTGTGAISGTPTVVITSTVYTVRATGSLGQYSEKTFNLSVSYPALDSILVNAIEEFTQNSAITEFIPVVGTGGYGTFTYSISPTLPNG
jgi:hypothetical protein